jgi:hypothetical protein
MQQYSRSLILEDTLEKLWKWPTRRWWLMLKMVNLAREWFFFDLPPPPPRQREASKRGKTGSSGTSVAPKLLWPFFRPAAKSMSEALPYIIYLIHSIEYKIFINWELPWKMISPWCCSIKVISLMLQEPGLLNLEPSGNPDTMTSPLPIFL